jgi:exonuclease III
LTEDKKNSKDFCDIISKYDIVCLSESWTTKNSKLSLNGYSYIDNYRKLIHKNAKRNSGGLVIYYRNNLKVSFKQIGSNGDLYAWCKLDKNVCKSTSDTMICFVYLPPEGSTLYNHVNTNVFDSIQNDVFRYTEEGHNVMLIGDTNARTAVKNDYVMNDRPLHFELEYKTDSESVRSSMDKKSNPFGDRLLDVCKATGLRICNGRMHQDRNIGKFIYTGPRGSSVVDYLIINEQVREYLLDFKVHDLSEFSDHSPIEFKLQCTNAGTQATEDEYTRVKYSWKEENSVDFLKLLTDKQNELWDYVCAINPEVHATIDEGIHDFTESLSSIGEALFKQSVKITPGKVHFTQYKQGVNKKWFDKDCV